MEDGGGTRGQTTGDGPSPLRPRLRRFTKGLVARRSQRDGHASKCPLRGQTTSQRDIVHLPSRSKRADGKTGKAGKSVQSVGNQGPLGFVGLCWTLHLKKYMKLTQMNSNRFRRFPEISGDFQSLFQKFMRTASEGKQLSMTKSMRKRKIENWSKSFRTGTSQTESRLIKVNQGWRVKVLEIKGPIFGNRTELTTKKLRNKVADGGNSRGRGRGRGGMCGYVRVCSPCSVISADGQLNRAFFAGYRVGRRDLMSGNINHQ
jgi:hypothetical protein